ncbi:MAG: type III pantothenate kinase [Pyrinomonadaceae bacterium]
MLLAIDIGNTNTKLGVYDRENLTSKISIPTSREITPDVLAKILADKITQPIDAAIISSVVCEVDNAFREFITSRFNVAAIVVGHELDFGLKINYQPPDDAGSDRLVNAFAAVEKYGVPCMICSFGTATTVDVVNKNREFTGGLIAPGMKTLAAALKLTTSKLPEVEIERPENVIQNTTAGAIQSGIVYGYFGLVEGLIAAVKKEAGDDMKVIATGGFAEMIAENTDAIDVVDKDLTLEGLRRLHERLHA